MTCFAQQPSLIITYLGPIGTYTEQAALFYLNWLKSNQGITAELSPCPTIAQSLQAIEIKQAQLAVVPVENSIEGSVTMTMDTLWQLDQLQIQLALVLLISHSLISSAPSLENIQTVYSHPQALAQCQGWLGRFLPKAQLIPISSTTGSLEQLNQETTAAAIASSRAAELYNLPILARGINDNPENSTRFWVISSGQNNSIPNYKRSVENHSHTSLAFSVPANTPGALVKALQVFANLGINLSRIESRPSKRHLGEYLFFLDLEADVNTPLMETALTQLRDYTEILKVFGSYSILPNY